MADGNFKNQEQVHPWEICISSYCFHNAFENNLLTALNFPAFCKENFGVTKLEFFDPDFFCAGEKETVPNIFDISADHSYIQRVREACDAVGSTIVAISAQNDFTTDNDTEWKKHIERVKIWIKIASVLETQFVRINTGGRLWSDGNEGIERMMKALRQVGPEAKEAGVTLAIENHPINVNSTEQAEQLVAIVQKLEEYGVTMCPDNGHIENKEGIWQECLEILLPVAKHCHVKFYASSDTGQGTELKYPRFFDVLSKTNYQGMLSIEAVPSSLPNVLFWFMIHSTDLVNSKKDGVPDSVVERLRGLEEEVFETPIALKVAVNRLLAPAGLTEYVDAILKNVTELDADFENRKRIVAKAKKVLCRHGAKP